MTRAATPLPSDLLITDGTQFGAAVRAARRAAKVTITDAALLLGIARQTLINLETAKSGVSLETALRAAREFGLTVVVVPPGQGDTVRRALDDVLSTSQQGGNSARDR
ncbi:MAG TPA: helix-turn-helix transcriptional regulator [Ramlibacter sp.]|jgi:DNA-binding XRE family transcriptional regulator|nr:helix-turn-helix transcriptional regulator [Ramlibacter sp.]